MKVFGALLLVGTWLSGSAGQEIVRYRCKAANRCERLDECIKETMGAGYTCKMGPGAGIVVRPVGGQIRSNFCSIDNGNEFTNVLFTGCEAFVEPPVAQVDAVVRFCRTSDCTDSSAQSKCIETKHSKGVCVRSRVVVACTNEELTLATCGTDSKVTQTYEAGTCMDAGIDGHPGEFFYKVVCGGGDSGNSGPNGTATATAAAATVTATASPEIVRYRCKAANRCERLDECIKETMTGHTCKMGHGNGIVVQPMGGQARNGFCYDVSWGEVPYFVFTGCEAFVEPVPQVSAVIRVCTTSDCTDSSSVQSKCYEMTYPKGACVGSQLAAACTSEELTLATCETNLALTQTFKVGVCTQAAEGVFYKASCGGGDNGNSGPSGDNGNSAAASLAALRGKY